MFKRLLLLTALYTPTLTQSTKPETRLQSYYHNCAVCGAETTIYNREQRENFDADHSACWNTYYKELKESRHNTQTCIINTINKK